MKFKDTRQGQWPQKKQNCLILSESSVDSVDKMSKKQGYYPAVNEFETAIFLGVSKKNETIASWECAGNPDSPMEWQESPYWLPAPVIE